jgi:hypothetical protein
MLKGHDGGPGVNAVLAAESRKALFVDLPWPEVARNRQRVRIAEQGLEIGRQLRFYRSARFSHESSKSFISITLNGLSQNFPAGMGLLPITFMCGRNLHMGNPVYDGFWMMMMFFGF